MQPRLPTGGDQRLYAVAGVPQVGRQNSVAGSQALCPAIVQDRAAEFTEAEVHIAEVVFQSGVAQAGVPQSVEPGGRLAIELDRVGRVFARPGNRLIVGA